MSRIQLDLRYWEITPSGDNTLDCKHREEKHVLLVTKEGDRVCSYEGFGYEKFVKGKQDAYGVFLNDGNTELLSSEDYDIHFQTVHDRTRGRDVTAILAIRKAS